MAKHTFLFLWILCLMFSSCQTVEQLPIEYMSPGRINFPTELRRVAIVNNTNPTQDKRTPDPKEPRQDNELSRSVAYHDGNAKITTESLAKAIADENYFDEVVICDSVLRANDKFVRETTLGQEEVQDLTGKLDVDFIISLENLQLKATKSVRAIPEWSCYQGIIDVKVYPTLKIYIPSRKGPMLTVNANDSIFWEEFGNTESYVRTHIIRDSEMLKEASDFAGTIPVKYLLPHWNSVNRNLFTGGSANMRDAAIYVREGSWNKAHDLWLKEYEKVKSDKKKMYISFNIALYHEVNDSLEQAKTWAEKAQKLASKIEKIDEKNKESVDFTEIPNYVMTTLYVEDLKKRLDALSTLNIQMSRFNDDF